jgi:hypothetical protein
VGIPAWTWQRSTDRQVANWSADARLGICLQTRRVRALDIDIRDPARAAEVREFIERVQGVLPVRWREGSGKCLLAFTMPGRFSKRVLRTQHGAIEFLADGEQFIAAGTHTSGARYRWTGLDLAEVLGGFPEVSAAEFEALWAGLVAAFPGVVDSTRRGVAPSVSRSRLDATGDPWEQPVVRWLRADAIDTMEGQPRAFGRWTLAEVAAGALGLEPKNMGRREELRLAKVLRAQGIDKTVVWVDGRASRRWTLFDGGLTLGVSKVDKG